MIWYKPIFLCPHKEETIPIPYKFCTKFVLSYSYIVFMNKNLFLWMLRRTHDAYYIWIYPINLLVGDARTDSIYRCYSAVVRVSNRHQRHHATFRNLSHLFLYCVRQRVCVQARVCFIILLNKLWLWLLCALTKRMNKILLFICQCIVGHCKMRHWIHTALLAWFVDAAGFVLFSICLAYYPCAPQRHSESKCKRYVQYPFTQNTKKLSF